MKTAAPLHIDGSMGEGGGQVLRSALSLSLLTGRRIVVRQIRAGRQRPGLMPQHLAAVRAAAALGRAEVDGARRGSQTLSFEPRGLWSGDYHVDIGTAGATSLVLQTLALPLQFAAGPSRLSITGGTHVPWSPCFHYLDLHWRPMLQALGYTLNLAMPMAGFYPAGGGCITAELRPHGSLEPLDLSRRGPLRQISALAAVADLPAHIAERMQRQVQQRLGDQPLQVETLRLPTRSPGALLLLCARFEHSQACYVELGKRGKPAEQVAQACIDQLQALLAGEAAVDRWLADQLLLPMALVPGYSCLSVETISNHLLTLAELMRRFLPVSIQVQGAAGEPGLVTIEGEALGALT